MARKKKNETQRVSNPESKPQEPRYIALTGVDSGRNSCWVVIDTTTGECLDTSDTKAEAQAKADALIAQVQARLVAVQPLTDDERIRLGKYEADFLLLETMVDDIVTALIDIRDNRLYRETHDTFEAYCGDHLKHTRRQADRLIAAFPINKALADAGLPKLPERVVREVADLPPEKAVEVVKAAKEENPDSKLTSENVRKARQGSTHRKDSHRKRGHLNEQDAQELEGNGNMVKVGDQYYAKGTPEYKAEMERREAKKPKGWISPSVSGGEVEDEKPEAAPKGKTEETPPQPREPYTDQEIVDSFDSWWDEWIAGLGENDESCRSGSGRVSKVVLHHFLTDLFTKDEKATSTLIAQCIKEFKAVKKKAEIDSLINEAIGSK